jgi:hypothetical protein
MTKSLHDLYIDLEKYKDFDKDNNSEKFLDTLGQIVALSEPSSIEVLIKYFDDDSDYSWVIEILQNNILFLFKNTGSSVFIKNLTNFIKKSPEWCTDTVTILFNDDSYLNLFRQNMHLAPKESLLKLFDLMQKESPHHRELIKELRSELEKQETKQH